MKEKTKKIWKKVGAGLLLGLSFLSLGNTWGKQGNKTVAKRAQNVRRASKEKLDTEVETIATIAEEEAQEVLTQLQTEEQQVEQTQVKTQKLWRYTIVSGWSVAMAVFFTSMIFNTPFKLGRAALSLLPGEPHTVVLKAATKDKNWIIGRQQQVNLDLGRDNNQIDYLKVTVNYSPDLLRLENVRPELAYFQPAQPPAIDHQQGQVTIFLKPIAKNINWPQKITVAYLDFTPLKEGKAQIEPLWDKSVVLKQDKSGRAVNILGKTQSLMIKIGQPTEKVVSCQKIDVVESRMNQTEWQRIIKGPPLVNQNKNWLELIPEKVYLVCAFYDDNAVYSLLIADRKITEVKALYRLNGQTVEIRQQESWSEGDYYFHSFVLDLKGLVKEAPNDFKDLFLEITFSDGSQQRLPLSGYLDFRLENKNKK